MKILYMISKVINKYKNRKCKEKYKNYIEKAYLIINIRLDIKSN